MATTFTRYKKNTTKLQNKNVGLLPDILFFYFKIHHKNIDVFDEYRSIIYKNINTFFSMCYFIKNLISL